MRPEDKTKDEHWLKDEEELYEIEMVNSESESDESESERNQEFEEDSENEEEDEKGYLTLKSCLYPKTRK